MSIPFGAHNKFPHRSKWLAYLFLQSIEALHRSGAHEKAAELMAADNRWVDRWKDAGYLGGLKNGI
jgi:hypothetical protein